jgi:hypothetical protein
MAGMSDGFTIAPHPNQVFQLPLAPWLQGGSLAVMQQVTCTTYPGLRLHVCRHHTTPPLSSSHARRPELLSAGPDPVSASACLLACPPTHPFIHLLAPRLSTLAPTLRPLDARRPLGLGRREVDR